MSTSPSLPIESAPMRVAGQLAYGALFAIVLPLLLAAWAMALDRLIALPILGTPLIGIAIAAIGAWMCVAAVIALRVKGGGWPMSPYPPRALVTSGIYALVAHPLYVGSVLITAGASIVFRSAAGLWIVTPVLAAACIAFVWGSEAERTEALFGARPRPLLRLVEASDEKPSAADWISFFVLAVHPFALAAAFVARRRRDLRRMTFKAWIAAAIFVVAPGVIAIVIGVLVFLFIDRVWRAMVRGAEWLSNSWRERRVGALRFINHGVYAAIAVAFGIAFVTTLAGDARLVILTAVIGIVCAALWAQWVEGSPSLLRPYGYYGALIGVIATIALTGSGWRLLAAYAVAAPFIQAIGRLRCLVQGCCHGRPVHGAIGVRVTHPQSRVVRIAGLAGVPLHPSALYSIAANLVIGALLVRLWIAAAPLSFIAGAYLILTGLERFVEEHYRGEPQTRVVAGLRLYQWMSIASIVAGAVLTTMPSAAAPLIAPPSLTTIALSLALGVLAYFAYGVDMPESNRRFARLA